MISIFQHDIGDFMQRKTELQERMKVRAARKREKRRIRNLTFVAVFCSLIISVFFVYDIMMGVLDAAEPEPDIPVISTPVYETPVTVRRPLEDFVVSDRKSFLVHLYADGKYYSCAYNSDEKKTVLDLLYRFSIILDKDDEINYPVDTPLEEDMLVKVGRVTYEYYTETEKIPYETEEIPVIFCAVMRPNKYPIGVPTEGEDGKKETKKRITYVDGVAVETVTISQKITKKPKNGVVYVDYSGELDLGNGPPTEYVKKYDDFEITAYTYVEEGGQVTYTGDLTRVGYVAVDRKVIPMYSKLYIIIPTPYGDFHYGYCYAMDTGGAIKNHDVDIFLPSLFDTNRFGRNKNCIVYVIREGKG